MKLVRAKKGYRKVGDKWLIAKKCSKCGRWLVANTDNFHRGKASKYGLKAECKECAKKYNRQYYREHKDKILEKNGQWKKDNPDKVAEHARQYYAEHKGKIVENNRQYRQEHKDEIAENKRQYYREHKGKMVEYSRRWKKDNPDKMAEYSKRQSEKRRQARLEAFFEQKWAEIEEARRPLVAEKTCPKCGRTLPASEFQRSKNTKDHLSRYCKECTNKAAMEAYYRRIEERGCY